MDCNASSAQPGAASGFFTIFWRTGGGFLFHPVTLKLGQAPLARRTNA
jgi:hypothetical protein